MAWPFSWMLLRADGAGDEQQIPFGNDKQEGPVQGQLPRQQQIPFGNDRQEGQVPRASAKGKCQGQVPRQTQIPFGMTDKKGQCKGNSQGNSRFPSGMTNKKGQCKGNCQGNSRLPSGMTDKKGQCKGNCQGNSRFPLGAGTAARQVVCYPRRAPKARSMRVFSSISWALAEPVAGLALAVRLTLSRARSPAMRLSRGMT